MHAAATKKERDEISSRMRPEVDRLIIGLNDIGRGGNAGETAVAIQLLVASLRANLAEIETLVGQRLETRERLAGLLQGVFRASQAMSQMGHSRRSRFARESACPPISDIDVPLADACSPCHSHLEKSLFAPVTNVTVLG